MTTIQASQTNSAPRIQSIDLLRGVIMILMLLDHSRNFWTEGNGIVPVNLAQTSPILFFTRWVTHFCAPLFVFLTGVSAYLAKRGKGQSNPRAAFVMASRGFWLIIVELTVVSSLWGMVFFLNGVQLQVIWAIGLSLAVMAVLQFLPSRWVGLIGILIIALHNLLPTLPEANSAGQFAWGLLHQSEFFSFGNYRVLVLYPVLPWIGVMALGYAMGELFSIAPARRRMILILAGLSAIALFIVLRIINVYGDSGHFLPHKDALFTFMAFINLQKYPPSLLFILITLGPGLLVLSALDKARRGADNAFLVFGRSPLFFYLTHLILLALSIVAGVLLSIPFNHGAPIMPPFAYPLWLAYLIFLALIPILYCLCRGYNGFKFSGKSRWWTYYL